VPLPAQESPKASNTQAANSQTVSAGVDSLLAAMSTEEKAGQMMQYLQLFPDTAETELKAKHAQIGSLLFMTGHLLATVKHLAAYGAAEGGRDYDSTYVPDVLLWNTYFPPYKVAIDAGAGSVMSAYQELNDIPASGNRWLLHDVLREDWKSKASWSATPLPCSASPRKDSLAIPRTWPTAPLLLG
jgi:hypothetical protein